jgi:hypothetical protein
MSVRTRRGERKRFLLEWGPRGRSRVIIRIGLRFLPRDLWVGVYWKPFRTTGVQPRNLAGFDAWVCLIPCLPIHLYACWDVPCYPD